MAAREFVFIPERGFMLAHPLGTLSNVVLVQIRGPWRVEIALPPR